MFSGYPSLHTVWKDAITSFEFVFGMISVITSLALTRLLSGCVGLYRHAEHIRFSWRRACWTAMAFMLLLGNWASFWKFRDIQAWRAIDVLSPLILRRRAVCVLRSGHAG
ncbi:hypothetical protein [Thermomonas sp.]|uniref:hypothetical protein n=1 Tax=Thermomonas sp. TaxID=1971895 RepID=UPI00248909D5|nr:hypothetical protein [Thermomonas sp.]MDI1253054.1 hypothetical protein [Thermomonas sp.]